jgi:hypothetical protein
VLPPSGTDQSDPLQNARTSRPTRSKIVGYTGDGTDDVFGALQRANGAFMASATGKFNGEGELKPDNVLATIDGSTASRDRARRRSARSGGSGSV